jgi:hypothetical protein
MTGAGPAIQAPAPAGPAAAGRRGRFRIRVGCMAGGGLCARAVRSHDPNVAARPGPARPGPASPPRDASSSGARARLLVRAGHAAGCRRLRRPAAGGGSAVPMPAAAAGRAPSVPSRGRGGCAVARLADALYSQARLRSRSRARGIAVGGNRAVNKICGGSGSVRKSQVPLAEDPHVPQRRSGILRDGVAKPLRIVDGLFWQVKWLPAVAEGLHLAHVRLFKPGARKLLIESSASDS